METFLVIWSWMEELKSFFKSNAETAGGQVNLSLSLSSMASNPAEPKRTYLNSKVILLCF